MKLIHQFADAGISNGHSSPAVPARHWWGIWWHTFTLDCWSLYSPAIGVSCYLSFKVIKIYGKLCNASNTVYILLLHEAFFGPKVLVSSHYFLAIILVLKQVTILTIYYVKLYMLCIYGNLMMKCVKVTFYCWEHAFMHFWIFVWHLWKNMIIMVSVLSLYLTALILQSHVNLIISLISHLYSFYISVF